MVMTTSKPISPRLADMNREDAEEVTRLIKENFDSLGDMLLKAIARANSANLSAVHTN
jgi:hypothetical protein